MCKFCSSIYHFHSVDLCSYFRRLCCIHSFQSVAFRNESSLRKLWKFFFCYCCYILLAAHTKRFSFLFPPANCFQSASSTKYFKLSILSGFPATNAGYVLKMPVAMNKWKWWKSFKNTPKMFNSKNSNLWISDDVSCSNIFERISLFSHCYCQNAIQNTILASIDQKTNGKLHLHFWQKTGTKSRRSVVFKKQSYQSVYEYPKENASLSPTVAEPQAWAQYLANSSPFSSTMNGSHLMDENADSNGEQLNFNALDGFAVSSSSRPFHLSQFPTECHTWPTDPEFSWSQIQVKEIETRWISIEWTIHIKIDLLTVEFSEW